MREFRYLLKFWGSNREKNIYSHTIWNRMWFASIRQNGRKEKIKKQRIDFVLFCFVSQFYFFFYFGHRLPFSSRFEAKIKSHEMNSGRRGWTIDVQKTMRNKGKKGRHVCVCVFFAWNIFYLRRSQWEKWKSTFSTNMRMDFCSLYFLH